MTLQDFTLDYFTNKKHPRLTNVPFTEQYNLLPAKDTVTSVARKVIFAAVSKKHDGNNKIPFDVKSMTARPLYMPIATVSYSNSERKGASSVDVERWQG